MLLAGPGATGTAGSRESGLVEEGQSPSALWAARQREGSVLRCRREEGDGRRQFLPVARTRPGAAETGPLYAEPAGSGSLWVSRGWLCPVSPVRS